MGMTNQSRRRVDDRHGPAFMYIFIDFFNDFFHFFFKFGTLFVLEGDPNSMRNRAASGFSPFFFVCKIITYVYILLRFSSRSSL